MDYNFFDIARGQESFWMHELHNIGCGVCKWHFQVWGGERVINTWLGTIFLPTLYNDNKSRWIYMHQ